MDNEDRWLMHGLPDDDPGCIKTCAELERYIDEVGFLPLFRNGAKGFSVEEHVNDVFWWSGEERDPWEWRMELARGGKVVYGRFYSGKAGFVSVKMLPLFANARRDGYDFDSRADEGIANRRQQLIMKLFEDKSELTTHDIKQLAGFGKGGEKNFEGTLHSLEDMLYLVISDFRRKINKKGEPYGWNIAVMSRPEDRWGEEYVRSAYSESAETSKSRILDFLKGIYHSELLPQISKELFGNQKHN